jgi:site-specific DNA-cytosine methylase
MWWTKSRRAQNVDDYETWISGGVVPTLNVFDNASETRATVLIVSIDFYNASIDERNFHTLRSGGANEGKPGVLIIDGTRVNDVRVYEDGIVPTVISRYGTGGGNVPMVFPIQDGREMEKNQNGLGIGDENAPAYTLDTTGGQAVAIPIQGTVIGRADTSGPQGKGFSDDGSPMFTLDRVSGHGVATEQTVRRLTPVECERLQGFPDNWTSGQADSNRYKQMGNAVAVPVVQWIVGRLVAQLDE